VIDRRVPDAVLAFQRGDAGSFEALVRQYQSFAYSLAMKFVCNDEEASDIVQESFIRVWKHIGRYDPTQKFPTWLYRIVANLCIDHLRSLERNRRLFLSREQESFLQNLADTRDWTDAQHRYHLLEIIQTLAAGLPPTQRVVFTLRDLQDLDVDEVAAITDLSVASVKTNLHYARKTLRDALMKRYGVDRSDL
jgi:RNA polymerase sigma-70 factor (ECF subfamily)